MENPIKIIINSLRRTLHSKNYLLIFLLIAFIFFSIFVLIPVFSIPGNSLSFQLEIFTFWNYVLMFSLAITISLMISMQIYAYKTKKSVRRGVGRGAVGGFSSIMAGLFGTASCASCVAAIFGFLGLGTVFFLIEYQWYIVGISLALVLLSIYLTSLSIERGCKIRK